MGKNHKLLEDARVHLLTYLQFYLGRSTLCLDYLSLDEGIEKVVEFMDAYFISQENLDSLMLMSKFQGRPNLLEVMQLAVKAALIKAYNKGSKTRVIPRADLITLPCIKSFLHDDL
ncbi:unnamed protein product [Lactuca saligna]|uniref:DNA replication factor RFC1 C-terminal domain-containing protein n=1 Tax=Lactuca saligna TaxID=75948 RepID=A0AA36E8V7_LACSI|nr:unnamed protein product [Lactuca saligna]CAI9295947.1 unnamed protein product [Lactuca saligna]